MHSFQVPNREEDACFWRNSSPPNLAAARDCPGLYRAEALLSSALHHSAKSKRSSSLLFSTACPCGGLFVWPGITCHLYHRWNQEPLKCLFFRAAEPPFLVGGGGGEPFLSPKGMCAWQTVLRFIFLVFQGIAANKTDVFIASVKIRDNFNPLFLPSPSVCLSITSLAFFPHLTPSATVTHSLCKQVCSRTNAQTPSITTHQVSPTIQASRHTMRRRNTRLHPPAPPELG